MRVALIQSPLVWENPKANRVYFEEKINGINESVNLIVLPEMFSTGFTMNPAAIAETMQGETVLWMQTLAKDKKTAVTARLLKKTTKTKRRKSCKIQSILKRS